MLLSFCNYQIAHFTGNLSVKVDGKGNNQKPSTPRSKHSATEQRRRSKINDRHVYDLVDSLNIENLFDMESLSIVCTTGWWILDACVCVCLSI